LQEQKCPNDSGCVGPPITPGDAAPDGNLVLGDAGSCAFQYSGEPRSGPAQGNVVELDSSALDIRNAPFMYYYGTTPLSHGSVRVEIERSGCGLATGLANPDGSFSVEGTAVGDVSVRLVPIDRPDLITTIHHFEDDPRLEYPILTRAALDDIFAMLDPATTPEPNKPQVLVNFILYYNGAPLAGATFSSGTNGKLLYDGGGPEAGPLGIGASVNGVARPYPGNTTSLTIHNLNNTRQTVYVSVAQGAVSMIRVEP